ncbi:hypothetical protein C2845_PM04G17950 [Panicum miliaceum]|uniref:Alpha/beta hydrolase fold-3 domain-containing protein n=1 Tax=Panicum miliaceum TaxID=4540 RepID=A0A3L6QSN8_PANMI|nr:hypothetical protein C2845_PM04G17950 [Panicum miliaceum]
MDSGGAAEVVYSCGYFRLYRDGRAERAGAARHTAPAGVTSKDVVIDAATGVAARLYLPPAAQPTAGAAAKLPVLVFYHGGYFVVGSPSHPMFHRYVNSLVAAARAVAVSVRYRLAPEHPLPAAYDDSWAALSWVASGADPWMADHGDLDRVFLSGGQRRRDIAHNMAIAAGVGGLRAGNAGARRRRDPAPPFVRQRAEDGRRGQRSSAELTRTGGRSSSPARTAGLTTRGSTRWRPARRAWQSWLARGCWSPRRLWTRGRPGGARTATPSGRRARVLRVGRRARLLRPRPRQPRGG